MVGGGAQQTDARLGPEGRAKVSTAATVTDKSFNGNQGVSVCPNPSSALQKRARFSQHKKTQEQHTVTQMHTDIRFQGRTNRTDHFFLEACLRTVANIAVTSCTAFFVATMSAASSLRSVTLHVPSPPLPTTDLAESKADWSDVTPAVAGFLTTPGMNSMSGRVTTSLRPGSTADTFDTTMLQNLRLDDRRFSAAFSRAFFSAGVSGGGERTLLSFLSFFSFSFFSFLLSFLLLFLSPFLLFLLCLLFFSFLLLP